jgi:antitoxin component YwqK of YwqJK toxin-antitoxin module
MLFALVLVSLSGCSSGDNRKVLDSYPGFSCSPPNTVKYESWGENGLSKSCVNSNGQSDGAFWAAESGRFFLRGFYKDGKERGTWEFVDKNGTVTQKVMSN